MKVFQQQDFSDGIKVVVAVTNCELNIKQKVDLREVLKPGHPSSAVLYTLYRIACHEEKMWSS